MRKFVNLLDLFKSLTLSEFHDTLYNPLEPLESVRYFPELDVYTVEEGHHRTVWALLTNTPYIKTEVVITSKLTDVQDLSAEILHQLDLIYYLVNSNNLTLVGDNIMFKDYVILTIAGRSDVALFDYDAKDKYFNSSINNVRKEKYLSNLKVNCILLTDILDAHSDLKHLPLFVRKFILSSKNYLLDEVTRNILLDLYSRK